MTKDAELTVIGHAELIDFPKLGLSAVPARIDSGAKTSSIWASSIREVDGGLEFVLFDSGSKLFNGKPVRVSHYGLRKIISSMGHMQQRYVVKLSVVIGGRKISASFSLANRASQAYPVLIGRNVLRGKFLVDVKRGQPLLDAKKQRSRSLQSRLQKGEK